MNTHQCCVCKKEALLLPYVCSDCLDKITNRTANDEVNRLKQIITKAAEILKQSGFEEECKSILALLKYSDGKGKGEKA